MRAQPFELIGADRSKHAIAGAREVCFDEGLVGQTIGSRVLLVIPPDKGYGTDGKAQAGIAGTDTLIFVVDLLLVS